MTRPRIPASAMTRSLPRPRIVCASPRARANRTSARSSCALCTVANRSAGPPTRIVVNRASGSSRDVLTPIRRWMSVPVGDRVEARRSRRGPSRAALDGGRCPAVASRAAAARTSSATASAAPGRPQRTCRGRHRGVRPRIVEQRRRLEQRRRVERLVVDQPRRTGLDQARRVGPLVPGRMRIRDDDHRQTERRHLGERRGAGAADDEVGRGERGEHLVAQERVRPVAPRGRPRAAPRDRRAPSRSPSSPVTWMTRQSLDEARQRVGDGGVEAPDRLRPAEDEQDPIAGGDIQPAPRPPRGP